MVSAGVSLDLKTSVIVHGLIATWYAAAAITPRPCRPQWGDDERRHAVVVDGDQFNCTHMTREWNGARTLGVAVTCRRAFLSGGTKIDRWWFTCHGLAHATLTSEGCVLQEGDW